MSKLSAFLRERTGAGRAPVMTIEGGASFAYVFGRVLVFLLVFEGVTGAALAAAGGVFGLLFQPAERHRHGSRAHGSPVR